MPAQPPRGQPPLESARNHVQRVFWGIAATARATAMGRHCAAHGQDAGAFHCIRSQCPASDDVRAWACLRDFRMVLL
eukprot:15481362-Alexandrium_andersonii.AAC.1